MEPYRRRSSLTDFSSMDDSPAKNDEDKRNELLQKERRSKKDARSFCPLFFLFFLSFFFARHPSTFPGAPRSHQISVVPGRATSLFLRTFAIVGDSFRQVETLLHHPLAASLSSSFFSVFFFASRPTFVFHQPARRRSPASHRIFHEFQMRQCTLQGQKGPVGVWVAAAWIIADYSRNLANLVLTARELARIRFFFLFLAFSLSFCFSLRVLWVAELRAGC